MNVEGLSVILALRWTIMAATFLVMCLAVRGFLAFSRGDQWIPTVMRSALFLYALSSFSLQYSYLAGPITHPPYSRITASLCLSLIAALYALSVMWWVRRIPLGQLRIIYKHIKETAAIAELAEVDPESAKNLADEARRLTAQRLMEREREAYGRS